MTSVPEPFTATLAGGILNLAALGDLVASSVEDQRRFLKEHLGQATQAVRLELDGAEQVDSLGVTLIVAAVAEHLHASAAVGAFLVGLTLTGQTADRARMVLTPLRDLFAAVFFVAIGLTVAPADLLPELPVAIALAAVTALTKVATGAYAARREGVGRPGQLRAGTALIARGEFSLVIIGLAGSSVGALGAVATPYVFVLAILGPLLARLTK